MKEKTGLIIIGSYRDFYKNKNNFTEYLAFLQKHKDIVVFGYFSKKSQYQNWHIQKFKQKELTFYKDENPENEKIFLEIMDKLEIPYVLNYYDSTNDFTFTLDDDIKNIINYCGENIIKKTDTFLYQMALERRSNLFLKKYENENNVYFTKVIKTRPDVYYLPKSFQPHFLKTNRVIRCLDFFYICNRKVFDILITKIDFLNFENGKKLLFKNIINNFKEKRPNHVKLTPWFVSHHLNKLFLDGLSIPNKEVWITVLYRNYIKRK